MNLKYVTSVWFFLFLPLPCHSELLPAAWDSFTNEQAAKEWGVWDAAFDTDFVPVWTGPTIYPGDPGSYSLAWTSTGNAMVWFYADEFVGNGAFVGNYAAAGVAAIQASVRLGAPMAAVDIVVYASAGPNGPGYYYSKSFVSSELTGQGFHTIEARTDDVWFYRRQSQWLSFTPDPPFWSSIEELGFRFIPESGSPLALAEMDDVRLVPTIVVPQVIPAVQGQKFQLSFEGAPGLTYQIERLEQSGWSSAGLPAFSGVGHHFFEMPAGRSTVLVRAGIKPNYVDVFFLP